MKRVLLTGGSGFVGVNLARRLLSERYEVHLILRPHHSDWRVREILPQVQTHEVDLRDEEALARVVAGVRPEWVFHLAAYGAYPEQRDVRRMVQTNLIGTKNLLDACLKIGFEAFVNTGSSSEYGLKDHAPAEDERLEPNSDYAVTKASATLFSQRAAQTSRAPIKTLRLYSVYGPYEEPTRFLPTLIVKGLSKELPPLVRPETARDFVYVDDVMEAYMLAASQSVGEPGAIYNVGTGAQTSVRQAVEVARRLLQIEVEPEWGTMPAREWDTQVWVADTRKIEDELGWRPRTDFEQGFSAMVEWFNTHPRLLEFYRSQIS